MNNCKRNCSICCYKTRCGGCSLCETKICSRNCNRCFSLCFNREGIEAYISKYDGFGITANTNKFEEIPMHIPIIPYRLTKTANMRLLAVHAGKLFSANGEKISKRYLEKGIAGELNSGDNSDYVELNIIAILTHL